MTTVTLAQGPEPRRVSRLSFRDQVRKQIAKAGIRGISRDKVFEKFKTEPRVKVTVALNELLGRREAYLRNGIYRVTGLDRTEP